MSDPVAKLIGPGMAYLLPGLTLYYSLTGIMPSVRLVFVSFLSAQANVGLFLIVILASLIFGLLLSVWRWIIFEIIICSGKCIDPGLFRNASESKLQAFQRAVDAHYQYHKFWGSMTIALLAVACFKGWQYSKDLSGSQTLALAVLSILVILSTGGAAIDAYIKYVQRGSAILS